MEFFDAHDWLNRVGPYAFTWDHLLMVFGLLALGVLLALFLRKKEQRVVRIVLICLWAFGVAIETSRGNIVYTSDFIVDYSVKNPAYIFDLKALAELSEKPTFLLMS